MEKTVLSVKNITKRFPGTVALRDVSFDVHENEILALMGENGAGKSTMMKILSGVYPEREYEGSVSLNGRECHFSGTADSENAGIAMIYQELNLELDLSVAENIVLGRYPRTTFGFDKKKKVEEAAKRAIAQTGLSLDLHMTVRNLSPSMQQLVCIARALYREPRILILDEPTSVLTETETDNLMKIIGNLKEQGISCIYISHKLDEVFRLCDRMVILRDGRKISEYEKKDGYESGRVIEDMIGRHLENMYPERVSHIGEEVMRAEHYVVPHPFAYGKNIIEDGGFVLHRGEILGFAGLVGAGRSELMEAIFGAIPKIGGKLFLDGKETVISSPEQAISYGLGFLSEDRKKNGYIWTMNIGQNMTLAALRFLVKGRFIDQKKEQSLAEDYFKRLDVKATGLLQMITSLSGGNQQKVILAKWLMSHSV